MSQIKSQNKVSVQVIDAEQPTLKGKRVFTQGHTQEPVHTDAEIGGKRAFEPSQCEFEEAPEIDFDAKADAIMAEPEWQAFVSRHSLEADDISENKSANNRSVLARLFVVSLAILVLVELGLSLFSAWQTNLLLFGLYTSVMTLGGAWAIGAIYKELKLLKRLKGQQDIQQDTLRLGQSMQMGEAEKLIGRLTSTLDAERVQAYYQVTNDQHNDAEKLKLYEQTVLSPLDIQAKKVVSRFAAESALLLAASPLALLDMGIILWRNQAMISRIAKIYGIELGYWSRIRLIRGVITNILYAGTSELVADLGTQMLSVEMSGKLSARLAQGLGGGLLTARLGYQAMAACRPIVFDAQSKPKLSKIHQELLSELKSFSMQAIKRQRNKEFTTLDK